MALPEKVFSEVQTLRDEARTGIVPAIFGFFQGRATFFALAFTVTGIVLAFKGKLDMSFVGLVGAIQALIVLHSAKEDYFSQGK